MKVTNFESIKDLMITDQIKRLVREQVLDDWGKFVSSSEFADQFDNNDIVKRPIKRLVDFNKL